MLRYTALLLAMTGSLVLPGSGQTRPSPAPHFSAPAKAPDDPLRAIESLLEKKQYADAEEKLQAVIATQSNNPQAWFDLGFAQSHLGRNSEAIAAYKKAVELSPNWFEANLNLGLALAKAGNVSGAAVSLRQATSLKPNVGGEQAVSNAWFSLAEVLERSDPRESLTAYQKAAELNPANAEAFWGSAKLMQNLGDTAGAEKNYMTAAQMGHTGALQGLVNLYLEQKRFAEAENWLQRYIAANPHNTLARLQLGRIFAAEGKTQEAIEALVAANGVSPEPAVSRELASLYLQNKQYDQAAGLFQDLLQKNPSDAQLHCYLGSAFLHLHKYVDAETELLQGLKINPHLDDWYWELAYAAQQNKHYELAIRALDVRAQRQPETAATYWIRAVSYDGLGAFKPAAKNYKLFLAADAGKSPDDEFKARHRLKAIEH